MTTRRKILSEIELAYIGGLFDGEGCVNIYRAKCPNNRYRYELSSTIYNCDKDIIE